MKAVHNKTGKLVDVSEDDALAGLQSGELALQKGQAVPVTSPEGAIGTIPAEQLGDALRSGFQMSTQKAVRTEELSARHQGLGDVVKGFGEGAASGASFGLSDLAIAKLGGEEARIAAQERAELRPGVRMAGEIVGAAAPMLLSGGTGAVGTAAKFAPTTLVGEAGGLAARGARAIVGEGATSLLGRVAQRAIPMGVQGAVEGAAYGAGQVVSENALGGHEITAEKLLAGAEHGMFIGGAVGGGLGAVTELGKAAAQKAFKFAGEGSLKTWLQDVADNQTIRALGGTQRDIGRLGRTAEQSESRIAEIAETVRAAKLDDGTKVFKPFSNASDLADKLVVAEKQASTRLAKVTDEIEKISQAVPEARPDLNRFFAQVDDKVLKDLKTSMVPELQKRAQVVEDTLEGLRVQHNKIVDSSIRPGEEIPTMSFGELRKVRQDLDSMIYQERANAASGIPNLPNPKLQALEQTRGLLEDEIERAADRASQLTGNEALAGTYQTAKREFRDLRQAKEMAERWQMRDLGNRAVSPTDYMTGIGSGIAAAAHGLGGIASFGTGAVASAAHNFIRERGSSAMAYAAERLSQVNALSHVAAGVDQQIEKGVKAALKTELPRAIVQMADTPRQKAFTKLADKVAELNSDPAKANEVVAQKVGGLATHAPQLAAAASTLVAGDMQYVAEKMPKRLSATGVSAGVRRVSEAEALKATRIVKAIDSPIKTIARDLKANTVSPVAIQAIRDRRPEIMKQVETQIAIEISSSKRPPSWEKQKQLSLVLGKPVSFQTSPQFKASIQQIYQQQQQGQAPGGSPKPSRRPATKLAAGQLTYSQKLNFE